METVNIIYSPVETLKTLAPNQRIATTAEELREFIAVCDASRTLIVEDAHAHHEHPRLHARHQVLIVDSNLILSDFQTFQTLVVQIGSPIHDPSRLSLLAFRLL